MRKPLSYILIFFVSGLLSTSLSSCKLLYPNRMFQTKDYQYLQHSPELLKDYVIRKGDLLSLEIFTREGFDLVDVLNAQGGATVNRQNRRTYLVDEYGFVEVPIFGNLYVEGMKERELEELLELKSSVLFNEPFVVLQVTNRRCILFKGSSGAVIGLNEDPTSILEVLALSGGLERNLKAYKVKIIRGDWNAPQIITLDLSKMDKLQEADMIVQGNDIIYIEDRLRVARGITQEIGPLISLISTVSTLLVLIRVTP